MVGRKIVYLFLLYLILTYNALYKSYDAYVILIAAVAAPAFSLLILVIQRFFIRVRYKEEYISAARSEVVLARYEVYNPTPFPLAHAEAIQPERKKKIRFSVPARNRVVVNNTVKYQHCGVYEVQLRCVYIYDFFRLFRFKVNNAGVVKVTILPRLFGVSEEALGSDIFEDNGSVNKKCDDRSEIAEIREYRDGDSLRDIHQKLSCRMSRLMVKIYCGEEEDEPAFLFWSDENSSKAGDLRDRMLEAMYAVMNVLLMQGRSFKGLISEKEGMESISISNNDELDLFFMRLLNSDNNAVYIPESGLCRLQIFAVSKSERLWEIMEGMRMSEGAAVFYLPQEECEADEEARVVQVSLQGGEQICFGHL